MKLIVATDANFGIGIQNQLPWSFAKDMQHFKNLTTQNPNTLVLMGRKTYESIPLKFKPLPQRLNVIISSQDLSLQDYVSLKNFNQDLSQAYYINSLFELSEFLSEHPEFDAFCIGGQSVYDLCLQQNFITEIFHTQVQDVFTCDRFLPNYGAHFQVENLERCIDINRNDNKEYELVFLHCVLR